MGDRLQRRQAPFGHGLPDPRGLRRPTHRNELDECRGSEQYLQVVSLLWNYATDTLDWPLGPNPAAGIKKHGSQKEFLPWPE